MITSLNQAAIVYPEFGVKINEHRKTTSPLHKCRGLDRIGVTLKTLFSSIGDLFLKFNPKPFTPAQNNPLAPKLGHYVHNDLRISNHVTEAFEWKKELIASAKKSIELSANFAGGEKFREVLSTIDHRMQECPEVKTHLLLSEDLLEKEDLAQLKTLQQRYGERFHYLITNRQYTLFPTPRSEENHIKSLVVDEKYFVTGGSSIHDRMVREDLPKQLPNNEALAAKFLDKTFRDTDLIGCGPSAQTMRNQFFNLYRIWESRMTKKDQSRYFSVTGEIGTNSLFHQEENLFKTVPMKFIVSGPEQRNKNPICQELVHIISRAQTDVRISNLVFNPTKDVAQALKKCKKANIEIVGYFNGFVKKASCLRGLAVFPNRRNYNLVTKAYEYNVPDRMYHNKVLTTDKRTTVIGSFNLGIKSAFCDYENICVIDDPRITQIVNQALDQDGNNSRCLQGKELKKRYKFSYLIGSVISKLLGPFIV